MAIHLLSLLHTTTLQNHPYTSFILFSCFQFSVGFFFVPLQPPDIKHAFNAFFDSAFHSCKDFVPVCRLNQRI
jgi:hypothetical protein